MVKEVEAKFLIPRFADANNTAKPEDPLEVKTKGNGLVTLSWPGSTDSATVRIDDLSNVIGAVTVICAGDEEEEDD